MRAFVDPTAMPARVAYALELVETTLAMPCTKVTVTAGFA